MPHTAESYRPRRLVLCVNDSQQESRTAVELVRKYSPKVEVIHIEETDNRVVPRLYTPFSAFEGLADITDFLKEELHNPIVKSYLESR